MSLQWALRKQVWDGLSVLKYKGNRPARIPLPPERGKRIETVPLGRRYRDIPIEAIPVAASIPSDELTRGKQVFVRGQRWLNRVLPPAVAGLPEVHPDFHRALDGAYSRGHRACFPLPRRPPDLMDGADLASLAVKGPYAGYLRRAADGGFEWDLSHLGRYEHHPGLCSLGVRVRFQVREQRLWPATIESELGVTAPADPQWELAKRIALCALSTHTALVRHFAWVHLAGGSAMAIAARNQLSSDHPLCRLLWPHVFATQNSNALITGPQLGPGGDYESIFSFTHRGLCQLFADGYAEFRLTVNDPAKDAQERGLVSVDFDTPSLRNWIELFDVLHRHAERYLGLYYESSDALRSDARVRAFIDELAALTPGGAGPVQGEALSRRSLARLLAQLLYLATVQHDLMGTFLWNYQLFIDRLPARVYRDGQREPLDVYNRLINANFVLNVHRTPLMDDFAYLALDPRGADAMRTFRTELQALDTAMKASPREVWKLCPSDLEANINA